MPLLNSQVGVGWLDWHAGNHPGQCLLPTLTILKILIINDRGTPMAAIQVFVAAIRSGGPPPTILPADVAHPGAPFDDKVRLHCIPYGTSCQSEPRVLVCCP